MTPGIVWLYEKIISSNLKFEERKWTYRTLKEGKLDGK